MSYPIQILRQLGAGGNGDIYIGQRLDTREFVVVKYLREHHLPHTRKAFEREVRILQRKLRGIVPLISADLVSEQPYYVMPYLTGGPLTQHGGRLFDVQLHNVAFELAQTFATLHATNIYHGDIKPDNILVSGDGPAGRRSLRKWCWLYFSFLAESWRDAWILGSGSAQRSSDIQRGRCLFVRSYAVSAADRTKAARRTKI